ncbi:hypothetical protein TNCT_383991 [Trichonephila clavata]|uniref:Uncharacterized protein n=1 Tax=Trichonephila clavata TaxID=2740835 RepID=A0A8X6LJM0_TRICU|nr:hypothetical protein TNCT_383991 [Trichonephila clavata]
MISSPSYVCIKNTWTGLTVRLVAPSCINVTVESDLFQANMEQPFHAEALNTTEHRSTVHHFPLIHWKLSFKEDRSSDERTRESTPHYDFRGKHWFLCVPSWI